MSKLFFSDPEAHNSSSCSDLYWLQLDRHSPTFYLNSLLFSIRSSSVPINWPVKLKQVSIEELFALKLRRIFIKSIHFQLLIKICSLSAKTTVTAHCYRLQLSRNDVMSLLREWCDSSRIPPIFSFNPLKNETDNWIVLEPYAHAKTIQLVFSLWYGSLVGMSIAK